MGGIFFITIAFYQVKLTQDHCVSAMSLECYLGLLPLAVQPSKRHLHGKFARQKTLEHSSQCRAN